jgi:serine 3-dehydrogenase
MGRVRPVGGAEDCIMGVLDGQVALMFGASGGIGRATALALAEAGASVALAARRASALSELVASIGAHGYKVLALPTDVNYRDQVDRAVASTISRFGRIDIMVNTAGLNTQNRRMSDLSHGDWERVLATNLTGALHTTQAVLPTMRSQGGGLIVQLSSMSGRWADLSGAAYQASKHGIIGLCQATMLEERDHGVRVTAILPGLVDTELPLNHHAPPAREVPNKAIQPEDVGMACVFLASLPARTYVPELIMMPPALQVMGQAIA